MKRSPFRSPKRDPRRFPNEARSETRTGPQIGPRIGAPRGDPWRPKTPPPQDLLFHVFFILGSFPFIFLRSGGPKSTLARFRGGRNGLPRRAQMDPIGSPNRSPDRAPNRHPNRIPNRTPNRAPNRIPNRTRNWTKNPHFAVPIARKSPHAISIEIYIHMYIRRAH